MLRAIPAGRLAVRVLVVVAIAGVLAAPAPFAQEAIRIADEVEERVETPHPYPSGGPGMRPVWSHTFHYPEASYIAVHFARFDLAPGDLLVLSDPEGLYRHTYEGRGFQERGGDFWGLSVLGDTMEVTLYSRNAEHEHYGVLIDRWAHGYPNAPLGPEPDALCGPEDFRDVECYRDQYPTEYDKARSTVRLIKNGSAHCTGWLVSCENHIMTNEHCVGSQSELDTIEFQFEYKRPSCGGGSPGVELQLQGGTLLQADAGLDYALIMPELAGNDPQAIYGYYQIDTRLPDVGELMYIPGHPSGDPKRLSIDSTHPNDPTGRCEVYSVTEPACTGGPVPDVGYFCDTEGGSSGSAVLSGETHKVIALHHCANCPNRGVPIVDVYNDIQASSTPLPPCTTCEPVGIPTDLVSSSPADNQVQLTWSAVPDAVAYRVHRSTVSCEDGFEEIARTIEPSYLDDNVGGGITYYYRVASESSCGAASGLSECSIVTPAGECTEAPEFAGLESAETLRDESCGIVLEWSAARPLCGAARYNVYRSTVPDFVPSQGNLVARCVPTTGWTDHEAQDGVRYYYVVRAEDEGDAGGGPCGDGNEEQNLVTRSSKATGPDDIIVRNDFASKAGWVLSGEWQIGVPGGLGGSASGGSGHPDPSAALHGSQVLGVDLTGKGDAPGDYEDGVSPGETALSPPMDTSGYPEVRLRFARWLNVNAAPGDRAGVEVCNGADCSVVWENPSAPHFEDAWSVVDIDVSDKIANTPQARVRFSQASDNSGHASGWNVDRLELYAPTSCVSAATSVSPVPDGRFAPGAPLTAERLAGDEVLVSWDAQNCTSLEYHLFFGDESGLASGSYVDARCALGTSGEAQVAIPAPAPGGLTWWIVAGADGDVEGIHGYDSGGGVRVNAAGGLCSIASQSTSGTCP